MKKLCVSILILLVVLLSARAKLALADEPVQQPTPSMDEINEIAHDLYCPVCENIPLDQCASQACIDMREEISILLQQGKSEEEIQEYFVEYHGDRVVSLPPFRGLNILLYISIPVALLAVIFFAVRGMISWISHPVQAAEAVDTSSELDDEYVRKIEQELKDRQK